MDNYGFIAHPPQNSGLHAIKDMLGIAGTAQSMARGNVALQQERALLQPRIAQGEAESRAAVTGAEQAAQLLQPRIAQGKAESERAQTGAQKSAFDLQREQASAALEEAAGLFRNPAVVQGEPKGTIEALVQARKRMIAKGIPEYMAEGLTSELISKANQPGAVLQQLQDITQANAGPGLRAGVVNAPLTPVSNGQQIQFQQLQPGAPGGLQPGQAMQQQLPPTTPVFNPQTNAPGYLGPQGQPQQVQSGPALGVPENVRGSVEVVTRDWDETAKSALKAAQDIGVLQEIKKYAPGAVTGVVSDRRSFLAGLAGLVGMDVGEMARTETDLLAKNANMLALAGGDTNLARTMAEVANPNIKMTKEAIEKAANQIIAQRQLAITKQQYLGQFREDPTAYSRELAKFNQVADPRILQLESMEAKDKAAMKAAMSPAEQKAFGDKIRMMYQMGILK